MRLMHALMNGAAPFSLAALAALAPGDEPLSVIELDTSLAEVEKPPEVTAGLYKAEIQDVQVQTSGKGNSYYAVKLVIPPSELPADLSEHYEDGAVFYWNRQLVPDGKDRRTLYNMRKLYEAMGLPLGTSVDPNEWMGREVRVRVVMGKYQGEDRAEIKSIESGEAPKPAAAKRGKK